uniref:acetyl-CoA carboxylase beta subunit n=1 Tax=Yoania japonica TaxID=1325471 RepID=UPI00226D00DD|nr:acetyl-CoA carboxylase beta subunit [Yoania japonica]UZA66596.1 acetyl-CoA carboxylase beta subunit [Yoania japonica]
MEKCYLKLMLSNNKLEHRCGLSKSMTSGGSEEFIINDAEKKIHCWDRYNLNYINYLFDSSNIWSLIYDQTFLFINSKGDTYSAYFDIENPIISIIYSELSNYYYYYSISENKYNWNNHINSCIDIYLSFEISINSDIYSYIYSFIFMESTSSIEIVNYSNSYLNIIEKSKDYNINTKYKQLWVQCDNCYGLNYKKFFSSKMNICEHCEYHLKMSSSDRIELFIDPGTWEPMDEDMVSMDPIEFHLEEEPYIDRISFYQLKTGLTEAVQTGIGQLNSISIAIGVMDFQFMGGSMGSVVGEKITRLIEYATNRSLPVIIVCASGGARMQEGSLSLMQMAKISSASYDYQSNKKLLYISILTSPTTGGVTASFGMLGDIIIAEPNAYIAFAGKRVIEQTLKKTVPDGSQVAEYLFHKGLFDLIVPRNTLKGVLNDLFNLHGFIPFNKY